MSSDAFIEAITKGVEIYDLGRPLANGIPQSPDHPQFRMSVSRRHGDLMRADGSTGANEILFTGGHVGTHIDALSHISFEGMLHGGIAVSDAMQGGRFVRHGAEEVGPWVCRGVLLDIPRALGRERLDGDDEVRPEDLDAALARAGVEIGQGDVVLVRTGWGAVFDDRALFEGGESGMPGVGVPGARWLADRRPRAVGSDTIAFEHLGPSSAGGLPAHKLLIVDEGIHIIETMDLETIAAAGVAEFAFVLSPLPLVGATGAPVRPLALVREDASR
ncbi:cyclase family protein [Microbacterium tumbae]